MTCPFAKVASLLGTPFPLLPPEDHKHHFSRPSSSSSIPLTLSDALRLGTVTSHRAVEKSRGVSLLLQSNPEAVLEGVRFDRVDYVRFQVMLLCIYIALEAGLYRGRRDGTVDALWREKGLLEGLARSRCLVEDIEAHLGVVKEHMGVGLSELADAAREESTEGDNGDRIRLLALVQAATSDALHLNPNLSADPAISSDHITLLTPAQTKSTLTYVSTLLTIPPSLLLAHAYTRYLGDLSGGQHIVRKVSKRFPCPTNPDNSGFSFYHFDNAADLKTRFRTAMDSVNIKNKALVDGLVREANRAFQLNTDVFESLLPPEYRMSTDILSDVVADKVVSARWDKFLLVIALAGMAAYVTYALGTSASRIVFAQS